MDNSPEYIKMCEKAKEIQEFSPSVRNSRNFFVGCDPHVWLPRQDQLQAMIKPKQIYGNEALNLHLAFHKFLDGCLRFKVEIGYSMEQLWFSFVMKERYSKIWNGENWINNES